MGDNFFDPNSPDESEGLELTPKEGEDSTSHVAYESISSLIQKSSSGYDDDEHRLEKNFSDPPIVEEIVGNQPDPLSLVQETADAVSELLGETMQTSEPGASLVDLPAEDQNLQTAPAADFIADAAASNGPMPQDQTQTSSGLLYTESGEVELLAAKIQMYEDLFSLTICEHSFEILVEKILGSLMKSVDAQAGSILEFDHQKGEYFFRASRGGASDKVKTFRVPEKQGIVGYVGESREALLINELEDDKRQLKAVSVAVGFEAKSCLALPIVVTNKLYGVLEVFNKMGVLYFTDKDKAILESGAKAAAKVLEVRFLLAELVRKGRT